MADQLEEIKKGFVENTLYELSSLRETLIGDGEVNDVRSVETAEKVFMAMHGICGTAPVLGFEHLVPVSRKIEMVFDKIRKGEENFSEQISIQTRRGIDSIMAELQRHTESVT
jgi:chemotaxis protein histidine kinase CheA